MNKCVKCGHEWDEKAGGVCPACGARAEDNGEDVYARGVTAEREQKLKTAARFYAIAADLGVPCAAYAVCRCMEKSGVRQEKPELYEFWLSTAAKTDAIAAYAYAGYLHRTGDERAALRYYRAAADMGHRDAAMKQALYYLHRGNKAGARYFLKRAHTLPAGILLLFIGRNKSAYEPEPIETPDRTVEIFGVGNYAMELGLPHIAFSYFEEAANAAYPPALEKTADMCMRGVGTERDENRVEKYLTELGETGNTDAYLRLGEYYLNGVLGGTPDAVAAVEMYQRAAQAKNTRAMVLLGDCYCDGNGVRRDAETAIQWYDRAASAGNEEGNLRAGQLRAMGNEKYRAGVEAQARDEDEEAINLFGQAAALGNTDAMCALGDCALGGSGTKASPKRAAELYRTATERGNARAMYRLGCLYMSNLGVRYNAATARTLLEGARTRGFRQAEEKLAEIKTRREKRLADRLYAVSCIVYHRGDHAGAAKLRVAAAKMGQPRATYLLGCMFDCGDGVPKDDARAHTLFETAARMGFDGRKNGFYSKYLHRLPR